METIEVIEENGEVNKIKIEDNEQQNNQIQFNNVEFPEDEEINKKNKKEKIKEVISTIIILIVIAGIIFGVLYFTGVIKFGNNNQNNQNSSLLINEEEKKTIIKSNWINRKWLSKDG